MKKSKLLIYATTILALVSLASCGSKGEHVHKYDTDNIDWCFVPDSNGGYSASATLNCKECAAGVEGHTVELPAGVSKEVKAPTCLEDGSTTYTASITVDGKTYTKDKVIPVSKTGHSYQSTWSGDETKHFHKCEHCDAHVDEELHFIDGINKWDSDNTHHWHTCAVCGLAYDKTYHTLVENTDPIYFASAATCLQNELYFKSCSICGAITNFTFEKPDTKLGHLNMHYVAEVAPSSCLVPGMKAHYECDRCGSGHYFTENTPYAEDTPKSYFEIKLGHDMVEHLPCQPTCDTNGASKTYYTCTHEEGLNNYYKDASGLEKYASTDEFLIPMTGHDFLEDGTCTKCSKTIATAYGLSPASGSQASNEIIFKSNLGTTYGKKAYQSTDVVTFPEVRKEGYLFAGWFKSNGKEATNGAKFVNQDTYTAYFIEKTASSHKLSDYGYETSSWWSPDNEKTQYLETIPATSTRHDIYFLFNMDSIFSGEGDSYTIFHYGHKEPDRYTGLHLRFRTKTASTIQGYYYGKGDSSLGGAGADTFFNTSFSYDETILIHMYEEKTSNSKQVNAGFELISMKSFTSFKVDKAVTFSQDYDVLDTTNNGFAIQRESIDKSKFTIKDLK